MSKKSSRASLPNPPSVIEAPNATFLVFEAPNDANLPLYIEELRRHNCTNLVRACDGSYNDDVLETAGISVTELVFADGTSPPDDVVGKFIKLLDAIEKGRSGKSKPCVAVHCVAGLGRAPVLVAIAMIESGLDPLEVIKEIRSKRPGALNVVQLKFLQSYKRRGKGCCIQ